MPYAEALTTAAAADAACWSGGTTAHLLFGSVALKSSRCSALSRGTECVNNRSDNSTCRASLRSGELQRRAANLLHGGCYYSTSRGPARRRESTAVTPLSYADIAGRSSRSSGSRGQVTTNRRTTMAAHPIAIISSANRPVGRVHAQTTLLSRVRLRLRNP